MQGHGDTPPHIILRRVGQNTSQPSKNEIELNLNVIRLPTPLTGWHTAIASYIS